MWECKKCHERHEDSFEVCWNCGTSKAGVEDPSFQPVDDVDPASLEVGRTAYEFTPEQNEVIAGLAFNMKIVGIVSLIAGGLLVVAGLVLLARGGASSLIQGILALIVGGLTVQAAGAFRLIVDSRGDDIGYLMTALGALRSLYRLQVILLCIALGLLVLVFCVVASSVR